MQDKLCNHAEYNSEIFRKIAKNIVFQGDLHALQELNNVIANLSANCISLNPLDNLILHYIYYVWLPEDLAKDFNNMLSYLTMLDNEMFSIFFEDSGLEKDPTNDVFSEYIYNLVLKIIYNYTNGEQGKDIKIPFSFTLLRMLINMNYSCISDNYLKILFIGYKYFIPQLFNSKIEENLFKTFIIEKKYLLNYLENNCLNSFEESLSEVNF